MDEMIKDAPLPQAASNQWAAPEAGAVSATRPKRDLCPLLMALVACAILLYTAGCIFVGSYDNDVWFILATGEYILAHGIPYTNPFSIQPDLGFVAQQWLYCVIVYLIYKHFGFVGLAIFVSALSLAFGASLFWVGRYLRQGRSNDLLLLVFVFVCLVGVTSYASIRPHLLSMTAFVWVVYLCESYRRTGKLSRLIGLPLIVVVHVNIHAAMAPYDLFIMGCYALPDLLAPFHRKGKLLGIGFEQASYARIPLWVVIAISAGTLFVNPYTVKGALYLFLSFGSAGYKDNIKEMGALRPAGSYITMIVTLWMLAACFVAGRLSLKRMNLPLMLLALASIVAALLYVRNQWLAPLFCFLFIAWGTAQTRPAAALREEAGRKGRALGLVILAAGVAVSVVVALFQVPALEELPENNGRTPVNTADYLDRIGADKRTTQVLTFFNAGGYLEYRGYKVNIDPRPELWSPAMTGQTIDYYKEYVDMSTGDISFSAYSQRFDFDVLIFPTESGAGSYYKDNEDYVAIPSGEGYRAYAKKSWLSMYDPNAAT